MLSGSKISARPAKARSIFGRLFLLLLASMATLLWPSFPARAATQGIWKPAGSMVAPRDSHTATLLLDGRVLIAGGSNNNNVALESAELFDPVQGIFQATGSMSEARATHTATLLSNGKVLIAGGYPSRSSAEVYDPSTGLFTATGSMIAVRDSHTATLLPNGKVLIAGGWQDGVGSINTAELYDPSTGLFRATGSMMAERDSHTATLLPNGKVLVAGGSDTQLTELYDPETEKFTFAGYLKTPRHSHTATLLPAGKVLVVAGRDRDQALISDAELYDAAAGGDFSLTGSMSFGKDKHAAALLPTGEVMITGGQYVFGTFTATEIYDPLTGQFHASGEMASPRRSHTATRLTDGRVLVAGGYVDYPIAVLSSAELFYAAGTALAWGRNGSGQLGDGTTADSHAPIQALLAGGVTAVSAGGAGFSLALDPDGSVWAWGNNALGELGNGTFTDSAVPVKVKDPSGQGFLVDIVAVSAGFEHSLALDKYGKVYGWGSNDAGQLGADPATMDRYNLPREIISEWKVRAIAAGQQFSLALGETSGCVDAWGVNDFGQLGSGDYVNRFGRGSVRKDGSALLCNVESISAGWNHALALDNDGNVWAWGKNEFGQVGIPGPNPSPIAIPTGLGNIAAASAGLGFSLALDQGGNVWGWGGNWEAQLGDGVKVDRPTPLAVKKSATEGLGGITEISAGRFHGLALDRDGKLWSWGDNQSGALGRNPAGTPESLYAIPVGGFDGQNGLGHILGIAAGNLFSLAIGERGYDASISLTSSGSPAVPGEPVTFTAVVSPVQPWAGTPTGAVTFKEGHTILGSAPLVNGQAVFTTSALAPGRHGITAIYGGENFTTSVSEILTELIVSPIRLVSTRMPSGMEGLHYRQKLAYAGGYGPAEWSIIGGSLPGGLALENGVIAGTPVLAGACSFTVQVRNQGSTDSRSFTLKIYHPGGLDVRGDAPYDGDKMNYTGVFAGENHGLLLDSVGKIWAWGYNEFGALGQGENVRSSPIPIQPVGLESRTFRAGAAGIDNSLALESNGNVWIWGASDSFLPAAFWDSPVPMRIETAAGSPLVGITAIAMGRVHALALSQDGTVYALGDNWRYQLGQGQITIDGGGGSSYAIPVKSPGGIGYLDNIIAISARGDHSLALTRDGYVYEWGRSRANDQDVNMPLPVRVGIEGGSPLANIVAVSAGVNFGLALDRTGRVWAWGENRYGELGSGGTHLAGSAVALPVKDASGDGYLSNIVTISAGNNRCLALDSGGWLWKWGDSSYWSLPTDIYDPNPDSEWMQVAGFSAGGAFEAMILSKLTPALGLHAWGYNQTGALGIGGAGDRNAPEVVGNFMEVAGGDEHSLALDADGHVWGLGAWGGNYAFDAQNGWTALGDDPTFPIQVTTGPIADAKMQAVSAGYHSLALDSEGHVWAWGVEPGAFQANPLGTGDNQEFYIPQRVLGGAQGGQYLGGITAISAGPDHSLALDAQGRVWAWGNNNRGQLGRGPDNWDPSSVPILVYGLSDVKIVAIAASRMWGGSDAHSLALDSEGRVWAWGDNAYGALGGISPPWYEQITFPIRVEGLTDVAAITAGGGFSLALKNNGTVWAWGYNGYGQFGNGNTTNSMQPQQAINSADPTGFLTGIQSISAGTDHVLARDGGGNLWAWGRNGRGQLGMGGFMNPDMHVPSRVPGLSDVSVVAAGYNHSFAFRSPFKPVSFAARSGVPRNAWIVSEALTLSGINAGAAVSISGGEYEINGSGAWTGASGTVKNGDAVRVRLTSAGACEQARAAILKVAGFAAAFRAATGPCALAGDLNGDGIIDVADAVLCLKLLAGMPVANVNLGGDANGSRKIGLEEALYILQCIGGLRSGN